MKMEHIRQFDWCASQVDVNFVTEQDLDRHSVVEKILRNKFYDPLVSSEDESGQGAIFNWDVILKNFNKSNNHNANAFVPGLRRFNQYPKLSALTRDQHYECLKVLCAQNPNIIPELYIQRPSKRDFRIFEEVKELYLKEQQEYIKWAQTQWVNTHCLLSLRPKPEVEAVYDAEFHMRAAEMDSFPKTYDIAAQIPIEAAKGKFDMKCDQDLIDVDLAQLPRVSYPKLNNRITIIKPCAVPTPCEKHPCRFILPSERSPTILPTTEVHKALGEWAVDKGAEFVCSESSLKCLVDRDKQWMLPITVTQVIDAEGERRNAVVVGSECAGQRAPAAARSYAALRHLLRAACVSLSEKWKVRTRNSQNDAHEVSQPDALDGQDQCSDDEDHLFIDADFEENNVEMKSNKEENEESKINKEENEESETNKEENEESEINKEELCDYNSQVKKTKDVQIDTSKISDYKCTCKDTLYERPLPRSYRKWRISNSSDNSSYNVIVHCSHKARDDTGEVLLEPIVEYQLDLGASRQTDSKLRSIALSYMLRNANASVMNVRIEGPTGELITFEPISKETRQYYQSLGGEVANSIHTTLNQLQGLMPGHYVLQHESCHGANAMLYAPRAGGALSLRGAAADVDEARHAQEPPLLVPVLLPSHKCRKILPCAFPTNPAQLAKEQKKPVAKQKTPPQAIKWPRRRLRKRKATNNPNT